MSEERPATCDKCKAPVVWCTCEQPFNTPEVILVDMEQASPELRDQVFVVTLSMYLGETCPYCLKSFHTLDDLKTAVFNGYTDYGRIAHDTCFRAAHPTGNNPTTTGAVK